MSTYLAGGTTIAGYNIHFTPALVFVLSAVFVMGLIAWRTDATVWQLAMALFYGMMIPVFFPRVMSWADKITSGTPIGGAGGVSIPEVLVFAGLAVATFFLMRRGGTSGEE